MTKKKRKEISTLGEIKDIGIYSLKDKPHCWLEVKIQDGKYTAYGPFSRDNKSEMFLINKDKSTRLFSSILALTNYLQRSAKNNYWNLREWIAKPSYSERLLANDAVVEKIDKHYAYVKSSHGTSIVRVGWDSPSDVKEGDRGSIYYVSTANSGLIKFRRDI